MQAVQSYSLAATGKVGKLAVVLGVGRCERAKVVPCGQAATPVRSDNGRAIDLP